MHRLPPLCFLFLLATAPTGAQEPPCRVQDDAMPRLHWIAPQEAADRERLTRWCRTVGPPAWLQASTARTDADSLVIVSWNVHVGGGDVPAFLDSLRHGRLTEGRPVEHFVLLLQEAFRRGDGIPDIGDDAPVPGRIADAAEKRRDILDTARNLGLWLLYVPSMRNGNGSGALAEDRGNAILSTLPLENPAALELPFEGQRRVAVLADVCGLLGGKSWRLRLCNVHLDNRSSGSRFFASFGPGRLRQARFLVQNLPSGPLVLGGDFNTWMPSAMEHTLSLLRRSFAQPPVDDRRPTYSRKLLPDRHVDHLYFQVHEAAPPVVRRVENRFGSDHHPVLAWIPLRTLRLEEPPRAGAP